METAKSKKNEISKIYRRQKNRQPKEFLTAAVETEEQLAAVEKTDGVKRIYANCGNLSDVWFCSECGKLDSQTGRRGERNCFYIAAESFETGNLMEGKRLFKNWFRKVLEAFWCGNMESFHGILDAIDLPPGRSGCEYLYNEQPGRSVLI